MGYRSQVRCLIYGTKENLDVFITDQTLIRSNQVFNQFKEALTRYTVDWTIYNENGPQQTTLHVLDLYGDYWKWYDGYPDVDAWMELLEEIEEADLQYEFIRIGENHDDIDNRSSSKSEGLIGTTQPQISENYDKGEEIPLMF